MIALKFSHFTKTYRPQVVQSLNEEDYGKCLTFACVFERKYCRGQAPAYEYTWPWLQQNTKNETYSLGDGVPSQRKIRLEKLFKRNFLKILIFRADFPASLVGI